jgi:uncharacterized protein YfaP (DUF2135 family)
LYKIIFKKNFSIPPDLHVVDPNGEEINHNHEISESGGQLLRDMRYGPNAVEFVSWGLGHGGTRGPSGNYKVYIEASRNDKYKLAVLEYPNDQWKYYNGTVTGNERILAYEFHITYTDELSFTTQFPIDIEKTIGICGMIYGLCECLYDDYCNCPCSTTTTSTTTTTTAVTCFETRCWCGNFDINSCTCNCFFIYSHTPHILLAWDVNTDLDLSVRVPMGYDISFSHMGVSSGGRLLKDVRNGPNGVEFISWGLNGTRTRGTNGNYSVRVSTHNNPNNIPFTIAILKSPDQSWEYLNGTVNNIHNFEYTFIINYTDNSTVDSEDFNGVCNSIYEDNCSCSYSSDCNCPCSEIATTTFYSFEKINQICHSTHGQCYCAYTDLSCNCTCALALSEPPYILLTWMKPVDLDLSVFDPNGEELKFNNIRSSSGGRFLRDTVSGPNAVEIISWGLDPNQEQEAPDGNYKIFVYGNSITDNVQFSVAVLEKRDEDFKFFPGVIPSDHQGAFFVYEFNLNKSETSVSTEITVISNFGELCQIIYDSNCTCGYDYNCNCSC